MSEHTFRVGDRVVTTRQIESPASEDWPVIVHAPEGMLCEVWSITDCGPFPIMVRRVEPGWTAFSVAPDEIRHAG